MSNAKATLLFLELNGDKPIHNIKTRVGILVIFMVLFLVVLSPKVDRDLQYVQATRRVCIIPLTFPSCSFGHIT